MSVFEYKGLDTAGKAVNGIVDADTSKVARTRLRKMGVFPTEIREQADKSVRGTGLNMEIDVSKYFEFVTTRDVSMLTTQLSTLVGAHIPMGEALSALVDQAEKPKLKSILSRIRERVNEGAGLGEAMSDHPSVFDNLYVQMVRAGERSGALNEVLKRLSKFVDDQVKLQGQVVSALAYPVLMAIVGIVLIMGLFLGVIPRIRGLIEGMGGEESLPLLTKVIFFAGDVLVGWWWSFPLVVALIVFLFRRWVRTKSGRDRWDGFKLKVPIFGKVNRLVAIARFCRTLSTLLMSGVPIISALGIVENIVGNVHIARAIAQASHNITEGQSIGAPLKASGQFPPMVTHMIAIGERTGELERMLTVVAESYEDEVEQTIQATTSLLGPGMIVIMGGVVFVTALGLLMPMMNLSSMIK